MRDRITSLRQRLSTVLRDRSGTNRWDYIANHRGMFSTLVHSAEQTQRLLDEYAIYTVAGGRINVAGFANDDEIERFAAALIDVEGDIHSAP